MGRNVDLCQMLGAPETVVCPLCADTTPTWWDDYDIDYSLLNPRAGEWHLTAYCSSCGHRWSMVYEVSLKEKVKEKA